MAIAFALERRGHKPVLTIAIVLLRVLLAAVRRWVCNGLGDTMARAARIRQGYRKVTDGRASLARLCFTRVIAKPAIAKPVIAMPALWSRRPYDSKKAAR